MNKKELLQRISINPQVMVGKPTIKGTRLTVQFIVGLLSQGMTMDEIMDEYKGLTKEDILACLLFAAETLDNTTFTPITIERS